MKDQESEKDMIKKKAKEIWNQLADMSMKDEERAPPVCRNARLSKGYKTFRL